MESIRTNAVKAAIAENGMTQAKLAESVGIPVSTLSRKINGKSQCYVGEALKICHALGAKRMQDFFTL